VLVRRPQVRRRNNNTTFLGLCLFILLWLPCDFVAGGGNRGSSGDNGGSGGSNGGSGGGNGGETDRSAVKTLVAAATA